MKQIYACTQNCFKRQQSSSRKFITSMNLNVLMSNLPFIASHFYSRSNVKCRHFLHFQEYFATTHFLNVAIACKYNYVKKHVNNHAWLAELHKTKIRIWKYQNLKRGFIYFKLPNKRQKKRRSHLFESNFFGRGLFERGH